MKIRKENVYFNNCISSFCWLNFSGQQTIIAVLDTDVVFPFHLFLVVFPPSSVPDCVDITMV